MFPDESAASPAPLIQIAPSVPFGVTFSTLDIANVDALKPMIQPLYGSMSQCEAQAVYTTPFRSRRLARSLYWPGSKTTFDPVLFGPVPGYVAWMVAGPPNNSAPVATSSA